MHFVKVNKYIYGLAFLFLLLAVLLLTVYRSGSFLSTSVIRTVDGEVTGLEQEFDVDVYDITPASVEKALLDSGEPLYYAE